MGFQMISLCLREQNDKVESCQDNSQMRRLSLIINLLLVSRLGKYTISISSYARWTRQRSTRRTPRILSQTLTYLAFPYFSVSSGCEVSASHAIMLGKS